MDIGIEYANELFNPLLVQLHMKKTKNKTIEQRS